MKRFCRTIVIIMALCLSLCAAPVFGEEPEGVAAGNLLVYPGVENGMEGWMVSAMDEPDIFRGESVLRTSIFQDVSLKGMGPGESLKLSGRIAAAPEDLGQLVIEMALACYAADGIIVQAIASEQEAERELTGHEIVMEIPEGSAFARVFLTIYKKSAQNTFACEDLCLEEVPGEDGSADDAAADAYTVTNLNIPDDAASWNGHYYYYYDDAEISWTMAENYCGINNGHLVTVTSAEEQAFLEAAFPGTGGWIGASMREDGSWHWITDEVFDYANWKEGEPDNKDGAEGHARLSPDMKWEDLPDEDTAFHTGYYCEWDLDTVTYHFPGTAVTEKTRALLEEGKGYYYGTGPEGYDIGKAWECFSAATDDYSAQAWYYLGEIMASGKKDTGKDPYIRAMGAYEKAAAYGLSLGFMGQADLYLNGRGVPVDYEKAMQLYQRAIDLGCTEANYGMGRLYQSGLGVEADGAKAVEYYQKAAGSEEYGWRNMARNALGNVYYEGCAGITPDYAQALNWYMDGAQEGYGPCCNNLGYMYYRGDGTTQDFSQAAYWFELAASRGERDGCYNIAFLYENGTGVDQNYALALEYYKKAALMGDIWAMFDLGRMYEEGLGTEKDYVLAREWYQKVLNHAEVSQDLRETIEEKLDRIQSEEAAALTIDPNQSQVGNYSQYGPVDYSTIDYNAFGWNPDGTIDYGAFGWNPDGTVSYGDEILDPGTVDPSPDIPVDVDVNTQTDSVSQDDPVNVDSSVLPQEGTDGVTDLESADSSYDMNGTVDILSEEITE